MIKLFASDLDGTLLNLLHETDRTIRDAIREVTVYGYGGNDVVMLERFAKYGHAFVTHGATPAAKRAAGQAIGSCIVHAVPRHMLATVRAQGRVGYDGQKGR